MARKTVKMATLNTSFRKAVHESYDYRCAFTGCKYCGNHSFRYADVSIEAAHFHNCSASAGRWHPDNVACLCHEQHFYLELHRAEERDFFYDHLGMDRFDALIIRMQGIYRYKPWERAEMSKHYNAQRVKIERLRADGGQGHLVLSAWD